MVWGREVYLDSNFEASLARLEKEDSKIMFMVMSVRFEEDIKMAVKLHQDFSDKVKYWVVLSPICLFGRLNKLSDGWVVLSKPVRQNLFFDALKVHWRVSPAARCSKHHSMRDCFLNSTEIR